MSEIENRLLYDKAMKIWHKVEIKEQEECWPWLGATSTDGYGTQTVLGGFKARAHRVVYELYYDDSPGDFYILHTCDNRLCCNPRHLYKGTQADNIKDMDDRGRRISEERRNTPKYGWLK